MEPMLKATAQMWEAAAKGMEGAENQLSMVFKAIREGTEIYWLGRKGKLVFIPSEQEPTNE